MKRIAIFIAAVTALAFLLPACAASATENYFAEEYLSALERMDFESAHDELCPRCNAIPRASFVDAWDTLVASLKITSINIRDDYIDDNDTLHYTIVYSCDTAGELSYDVTAGLRRENGHGYIEFGYGSLISGMEAGDTVRDRTLYAQRGEIFSSDGTALAQNSYADTVYIDVEKTTDINSTIASIDLITTIDTEKVKKDYDTALARNYGRVAVTSVSRGTLPADTREKLLAIPGVGVDNTSMTAQRYYPFGEVLAHTVGYCGTPSEEELAELKEKGYTASTLMGKTGLESSYEDMLHATNGYAVELIDEYGKIKSTLYKIDAQNGKDIRTSIDISLQQKAYYALASSLNENQTGVAITMDPKTGFVTSSASYPSYDSNMFAFKITKEDAEKLYGENSGSPTLNRVTQSTYPPGSSFKVFSIVPALESGAVTPDDVFPYEIVDNKWTPNEAGWVYPAVGRNRSTPGELNLTSALRSSDNIYFAWTTLKLGEEKFMDYLQNKLKFDDAIDYDLPVKQANIINKDTKMNRKILSDMGFGMAELLVSPIQNISMYTSLLNDGNVLAPRLVKTVTQSDGLTNSVIETRERTVFHENVMDTDTISDIMPGLRAAVKSGTANAIRRDDIDIAGKTGTAIISDKRHISWMIAFYENYSEDKLVLVMVDGPKDQDECKFTIANVLLDPAKEEKPASSPTPGEDDPGA